MFNLYKDKTYYFRTILKCTVQVAMNYLLILGLLFYRVAEKQRSVTLNLFTIHHIVFIRFMEIYFSFLWLILFSCIKNAKFDLGERGPALV